MSLLTGGGFRTAPRRVLEDALGTGVMDELSAGHQPLLHGHLAPRAETVGDVGRGSFGGGGHGSGIVPERREPCQPTARVSGREFFLPQRCRSKKSWYSAKNSLVISHPHTERRNAL